MREIKPAPPWPTLAQRNAPFHLLKLLLLLQPLELLRDDALLTAVLLEFVFVAFGLAMQHETNRVTKGTAPRRDTAHHQKYAGIV